MFEIQPNVTARLPVILQDITGTAVNGVLAAGVTLSMLNADGTGLDIFVSSSEWVQLTGAAYTARGYYNLFLSSTHITVTGVMQYCINASTAQPYFGVVKVAYDTNLIYDRIGLPISGTISNDIQNIPASVGSGGFTALDRSYLSSTFVTASRLPTDPASNSYLSGVIAQDFTPTDRNVINAIKAKTDYLPSDPASNSIVQGYVNTAVANIEYSVNNSFNSSFSSIMGPGWLGTVDTLHNIGLNVFSGTSSTSATIAAATNYIVGAGFIVGTDDLHNISLQIQGITPGSGGGGFSTTDRSMLVSAYSSTLPLPADPASNSYLSGIITSSTNHIMGAGIYGAGSGSTIYEAVYSQNNGIQYISNRVSYLPMTTVAAQQDILDIKGLGWAAPSDTLHVISQLIQSQSFSSSFEASDRAMLSAAYASSTINYNIILQVKSKTDNLPVDPVSTAHIDPQLANILSSISVAGGFSTNDRDNINTILTSTNRLPLNPADQNITFGTNDRTQLISIYGKTANLPADPVSQAYVLLVSQSLDARMTALSGGIQQNNSQGTIISSAVGTISSNVIIIQSSLAGIASDSSVAAGSSAAAASSAASAAVNSITSANNTNTIIAQNNNIEAIIGSPNYGSVSADISDVRSHLGTMSVSISNNLDPVIKILGKPNITISDDLRQVGKISQDVQKKVS